MSFFIGWFSTGRDAAARDLLQAVWDRIQDGFIPAAIRYLFCDRDPGETEESDLLLALAAKLGIKTITYSSRRFLPDLRRSDREGWRMAYHRVVMERIDQYNVPLIVLAGYMLIVSPEMCARYSIINLHPALPGGPTGAWEDVIDELIRGRATKTGAMMHLVTAELDRGPVVTYTTFSIQDGPFAPLWKDAEVGRGPLFWLIREQGVRREIPLIILTLKAVAEGKIRIEAGKVLDSRGKVVKGLDLTAEVEAYLEGA